MPKLKIAFLFILTFALLKTNAQEFLFRQYEDTLHTLSLKILEGEVDYERYEANENFLKTLTKALKIKGSFDYPFDSIGAISILKSPDEIMRVLTWAVPRDDGTFEYFGIIQAYNERSKNYDMHFLTDKSDEMGNVTNKVLQKDLWYGAIYTELIQSKYNGRTYYTVLGWDGHSNLTNQKIIDVITIKPTGIPYFGASLFKGYESRVKRVIFTYSDRTSMILHYDRQTYSYRSHKFLRKKKRITKTRTADMIVFDRLAPIEETLEGQYQFYAPETNIHDAFILENGRWKFLEEIDARNPEVETPPEGRGQGSFQIYTPVQ